ncbi:MAG: twin-arginine translocation pathway signal protein [Pelagibacterium sp. SCN 63-23]|nr:MAG: twin-arginine translocation pathway signal protein [Pelagibacterium sp. SCN 63-23]
MTHNSQISRRRFVAAGTAGLALMPFLGAWAFAQPQVSLTTAFGWVPNVQYAGHWIALEKGFFAEEGIDAQHLAGGPNAPQSLVTLATGAAQVAHGQWLPLLDARARGNDFVMIGANFPINPAGVISLPGKPIRQASDLVGARILAQGEADREIIEAIFALNNLEADYTFVPSGFSPEPLLAGDGDVYMSFVTNQPITLEQMGMVQDRDFIVTLLADLGYVQPGVIFTTDRATLESRRDELVRYLRALLRGWKANAEDPEVAARLVVEKYGADLGLDLNQQIRQNELQIPYVEAANGKGMFWLDEAMVTGPMYDVARVQKRELPADVSDILDISLLAEAQASL